MNEAIDLTSNKLVNKNNAFSVELVDSIGIDTMEKFLQQQEKVETKWLRTGEAIGAGAKIYGYRVDNVHHDTYQMINRLARNANDEEELPIVNQEEDEEEDEQ